MTQTLASDMARKSLAVFLERAERQSDVSANEAREFLSGCEVTTAILEKNWLLTLALLDRGVEGRKFTFFAKDAIEVLELAMKGFDVARFKIKAADLATDVKTSALSLLESAGLRAATMRDKLLKLLSRLDAPPRPINVASLPAQRDIPDAPGYIDMDEFADRLLSGGKP